MLVSGNTASGNWQGGIYLEGNNNTITGNTASNNGDFGIALESSSNNTLYHNNLDGNTNNNAYDDGTNQWDSGSEGNYYGGDYTGTDSDGDGIGDTPYFIPGGGSSVDRYPLINPVYLPDLTITDISFSKDNPAEGEPITITATIKNIGNVDAEEDMAVIFSQLSNYELYECDETGSKAIIHYAGGKIVLKSGESLDVAATWNAAPVYNTTNFEGFIHVEVDALNQIDEINENNNEKYGKITLSSRSDFRPENDSYHFYNFAPTSGEIEEMALRFETWGNLIANNQLGGFLDLASWAKSKIFGSGLSVCYGISASSILYYEEPTLKPVGEETFSMLKTDDDVRSNIIEYESMQGPYLIFDLLKSLKIDLGISEINIKDEYKKINNSIKNGEPIISIIRWPDSHAVVAYNTYDISESVKNVLVYDSNYPGMARVIQFNFNKNEIIYEHYNYESNYLMKAKYFTTQRPLMTFSDGGKYLNKILEEFEKAIVKNLYDKKFLGLFFQCPINITVIDQYGRIIDDNGNSEIPDAEVNIIGDLKMFLLPVDLNYTVTVNAYDSGNFSFTQINPTTNESASVISFVDVSINENTKAIIDVNSVNPEYTMQIDYDGDGITDEIKEPDIIDTLIVGTTPPSSITNPHHAAGTTWLNWTWANPPDPDFNHTEIYLNGIFQTIISAEFFNATDLTPETTYTINTHTVDTAGNINQAWVNDTATTLTLPAPPSAASSSATGAPKDTYRVDEDVYAAGSGFAAGTNVDLHVVHDRDWNDGDQIPADVTGAFETVYVVDGEIAPVLVWHAPLVPGSYDIVIDANQTGDYDAATDGLDSGSPGFVVVAGSPPTPPVPVPALAPIGILALIGLLCVAGVGRIRGKFN